MAEDLINWNKGFEAAFEQIELEDRLKAGSFLPVVPNRQQWDEFLRQVKADWRRPLPQAVLTMTPSLTVGLLPRLVKDLVGRDPGGGARNALRHPLTQVVLT